MESYESTVRDIQTSTKESYYAVHTYDDEFYIYDSKNNTLKGKWEETDGRYAENWCFVNDREYVIFTADGTLVFCDAADETVNEFSAGDDFYTAKCYFTDSAELALVYQDATYCVADLQTKKILYSGGNTGLFVRSSAFRRRGVDLLQLWHRGSRSSVCKKRGSAGCICREQ